VKRRGFTLIELMVVIAIIIILAAIAIPNYLSMTARAKKSRVASDFAALATALETFKTDWNQYPPCPTTGGPEPIIDATSTVYLELTGTTGASVNTGTTAAGETAPIEYMTTNILKSMINPYSNVTAAKYTYESDDKGTDWVLVAPTDAAGTSGTVLSRTDLTTTLTGPAPALTLGN
jgi:prepilin-type N-terminal cleavage/methylation domain-containing protein